MSATYLHISCARQVLEVYENNTLANAISISTGKNGTGQTMDTGQTPLGWHYICEKYGDAAVENTVFVGRKSTGEIYTPTLHKQFPQRDWILTRILRLKGLIPNYNLGGNVDTFERYIYIHGTPDSTVLGLIGSKGCIRMDNKNIMDLYEKLCIGTPVYISDR